MYPGYGTNPRNPRRRDGGLRNETPEAKALRSSLIAELESRNWSEVAKVVDAIERSRLGVREKRRVVNWLPEETQKAYPGPLTIYLTYASSPEVSLVRRLLTLGASSDAKHARISPIDLCFQCQPIPFETVIALLEFGAKLPNEVTGRKYLVGTGREERLVGFYELLQEVARLEKVQQLDPDIRTEFVEHATGVEGVYWAYRYLAAVHDSIRERDPRRQWRRAVQTKVGEPFLRLVRETLFFREPGSINTLVMAIENLMDNNEKLHGWHANESELMLLMSNPRLSWKDDSDRALLNSLSRALTSITRFINHDKNQIDGRTLRTWGDIGLLTHSHFRWRFDAQRINPIRDIVIRNSRPSLLEAMGFERVPERSTDKRIVNGVGTKEDFYGPGYLISPHDWDLTYTIKDDQGNWVARPFREGTVIELRRAWIGVRDPELGWQFVRNSSFSFGRDRLPHPAYFDIGTGPDWSTTAFLNVGRRDFMNGGRLKNIIDPEPYGLRLGTFDTYTIPPEVYEMTRQLVAISDYIYRQKYDTNPTNWEIDKGTGKKRLIGGLHHSEAFRNLVQFLALRREQVLRLGKAGAAERSIILPELAFYDRDLPPWCEISYLDRYGKPQTRMQVTGEVLDCLEKVAEYKTEAEDIPKFADTGLTNFFQAGVDHRAELVMVAPLGGQNVDGDK